MLTELAFILDVKGGMVKVARGLWERSNYHEYSDSIV